MAEVRKLTMTYRIIRAFSLTSWSKSILQYPPTSHYIHGLSCLFFFLFLSIHGLVRVARSANSHLRNVGLQFMKHRRMYL